ncbi:unnamed protein product [Strongylus vulgaris]|uniref:SCP domain-containing protein n=1 Tax=Strongylus vulgaris TaxID=40348 RepID=A0A3P7KZ91_STRVU|nr:unnamed protein product [Strongylus vulgaris]
MEQQAQDAIKSCSIDTDGKGIIAYNSMKWYSSNPKAYADPSIQINRTLTNWWGEARENGVKSGNIYTGILYSFANMVFSETTKIGCAYKVCRGKGTTLAIICTYNEIAYFDGNPMWETGQPCKVGADCTTFEKSGCSDGLCTKGPPIPGETCEV